MQPYFFAFLVVLKSDPPQVILFFKLISLYAFLNTEASNHFFLDILSNLEKMLSWIKF
jgi:hypothetical protein